MRRGRAKLAHDWEHPPTRRAIGRLEALAYKRHARDLKTGHRRGLWFDDEAADRAVAFVRLLHHSKGRWAGQRFELTHEQEFIVRCAFGWKRADGTRRYREAYVQEARKNGKTFLAAAIALYAFLGDAEPGAEVYAAATKRDQARITFDAAAAMVRSSPELRRFVEVSTYNLACPRLAAKFEPLSADSKTLDGLNVHLATLDELHAHKTSGVYDVLRTALGARLNPLLFIITTPGAGQEGVCWSLRQLSGAVLEGTGKDDALFAYICEPDEGDDWTTEKAWEKGNPLIDVTIRREDLRDERDRALLSPALQNAFRRLRCGQWTEQVDRWLDMRFWRKCGGPVDPGELFGRPCFAGLDLATTRDLSALVLVFPPEDSADRWPVLSWAFCPGEDLLDRQHREGVPYTHWRDLGVLDATPGDVTDYDRIRAVAQLARERYDIRRLGFDPWNAQHLVNQLESDGIHTVKVPQTITGLNQATKALERLVLDGRLAHGDNPLLTWSASSVAVWEDGNGNIKPSRRASGGRIDPIVALIIALTCALEEGSGGSIYDELDTIQLCP